MATRGIHGNLLEVTIVSCSKLKDTEWISRQDPYVCVEYGSNKSRTRTCTDGGKNPTFQEKFVYTLIEGLGELGVDVWSSNTNKHDSFIGCGKVSLEKAISHGYDDSNWPLRTKSGRHAGEVRLMLRYSIANKPASSHGPTAPPYGALRHRLYYVITPPPPSSVFYHPPTEGYPAPFHNPSYQPNSSCHRPASAPSYPPTEGHPAPSSYQPSSCNPLPASDTPYQPAGGYPAPSGYPYQPNLYAYAPYSYAAPYAPPNPISSAHPPGVLISEGETTSFAVYPHVPPGLVYAPQLFSDDNPNGCSIM